MVQPLRPDPLHPVRRSASALAGGLAALALAGCSAGGQGQSQRLQRLELRLQQLEQRLNTQGGTSTADPAGKPPAGVVKSLTFRSGTSDDRLRIYWADGSRTDLPCTREQHTWACG